MIKVYETESDLHVREELIYVKSTHDGYGYADEDCTVKISSAELLNAFKMGTAVIVDAVGENRVTKATVTEAGVVTLYYIKATTAETVTTLSEVAVNGKEYSAS